MLVNAMIFNDASQKLQQDLKIDVLDELNLSNSGNPSAPVHPCKPYCNLQSKLTGEIY